MVIRLENKWIDASEAINTFNAVNEDLNSDDEFEYTMKVLNGYKQKQADVLEQIQEVYVLTGKTLRDLPNEKVRSAQQIKKDYRAAHPEDFEVSCSYSSYKDKQVKKVFDVTQNAILENINRMESMGNALSKQTESIKNSRLQISDVEDNSTKSIDSQFSYNGNKFYIVHTPVEKCKAEGLYSGWLLPDGTFYGGRSIFIHRGILEELDNRDFFKDKDYCSEEDDVQTKGGWLKVSGSDWLFLYKAKPTNAQVEFMIQFTIEVTESNFLELGISTKIHVQVLAEMLNGREFDIHEMEKDSEGMEELKKDKMPTVKEVSDIDVLNDPFFIPNTEFVKWLIEYANGRTIVDCGAGSGYLCALIENNGGNAVGLEPRWSMERKEFWMKKGFMFNVMPMESENSIFIGLPPENMSRCLFVFARPCHNGFVSRTINKLNGAEILYIGHGEENKEMDLPVGTKYTKLDHKGTSVDNEYVLSIKK